VASAETRVVSTATSAVDWGSHIDVDDERPDVIGLARNLQWFRQ
jgi:hypothetical protein